MALDTADVAALAEKLAATDTFVALRLHCEQRLAKLLAIRCADPYAAMSKDGAMAELVDLIDHGPMLIATAFLANREAAPPKRRRRGPTRARQWFDEITPGTEPV